MRAFFERLTKGSGEANRAKKAEKGLPDERDATPAGAAVRLEPRAENRAEHAYPAYRLLVALVLIEGAAVLGLTASITVMMPLKKIEPYFLQLAEAGKQVWVIEPLRGSSYRRADAVFESIAQSYVRLRHEVIEIPYWMAERWSNRRDFIGAHSATRVWDQFQTQVGGLLTQMRERPYRRKVKIERITRARGDGWRYTVVFETSDSLGSIEQSEAVTRRFESLIELRQGNYGEKPSINFARVNPFGIFVVGYDVRELKDQP